MTVDAHAVIVGDLKALRRGRARHFLPALMLCLLVLGGFLLVGGLRPDLWRQPGPQLPAQLALWLLGLVALPAIGLGLWFPRPAVSGALAAAAAIAAMVAALGIPLRWPGATAFPLDRCGATTLGSGIGLLAIAVLSGAFVARRRPGSALWVSAGVALMALDVIVWHCPSADPIHNLYSHLGAAIVVLMVAAAVGLVVHRRQRPAPP